MVMGLARLFSSADTALKWRAGYARLDSLNIKNIYLQGDAHLQNVKHKNVEQEAHELIVLR